MAKKKKDEGTQTLKTAVQEKIPATSKVEELDGDDSLTAKRQVDIPARRWAPKMKLKEGELERLGDELQRHTKDWEENRGNLEDDLANWNDLVEGIVSQREGPWENSSNLHIPLILIHMFTVHTVLREILLDSTPIAMYYTDDKTKEAVNEAQQIQIYVDHQCKEVLKLQEIFSDALWICERDGNAIGKWVWALDVKRVSDVEHYESQDDFVSAYSTPEEAKMDGEEYTRIISALEEGPQTITVEYDDVIYKGPRMEIVELKNFVTFPVTEPNLDKAQGVGERLSLSEFEIRQRIDDGIIDEEPGKKLLESSGSSNIDAVTQSQNDAEGISEPKAGNKYPPIFEVVYAFRMDKKKRPMDILVRYSQNPMIILSVERWPYRRRHHVKFKLIPRPGRAFDWAIPRLLEDMNVEVNTQHNQRIDTRSITTIPSFTALNSAKDKFDPSARNLGFHPGVTYWLDSHEDVRQMQIRPTDLGESIQEEGNLFMYGDMIIGDGQLQTGREQSRDPRSPATKTLALIAQSNKRINDYAIAFSRGMISSYEILNDLYFHNGDPVLKFGSGREEGGFEIPRASFRKPGLRMRINGAQIQMTKDQQLQKTLGMYEIFKADPDLMNPEVRYQWKRRIMELGYPEGNWEHLVRNEDELKAEMMERVRAMILQMVQEKALPKEAAMPLIKSLEKNSGAFGMDGQGAGPSSNGNAAPVMAGGGLLG